MAGSIVPLRVQHNQIRRDSFLFSEMLNTEFIHELVLVADGKLVPAMFPVPIKIYIIVTK